MLGSSKTKWIPAVLGILSFGYYALLSAKDYTWVFVSGDSGDWLATANWWMVPQPYGSPLYILLCRLVGFLPGSQSINLTLLLSAVPAAITVSLVYLIVQRLTGKRLIAIVSSLVLVGSTVFLTQATVLEEYMLTAMLLTLAFYLRQCDRPYASVIALSFGVAVHITLLFIGVFWLIADRAYWSKHHNTVFVGASIITVAYGFILLLMAMDTPRLLAGGFSYTSVKDYLLTVGGAVVGQLSVFELPLRLWDFIRVLLVSVGLALIPVIYALRRPVPHLKLVLLGTIFASVGYYLICIDYTTWTFLTLTLPSFAILAGVGLSNLKPFHTRVVLAGCACLMLLNGVFMNANTLTRQNPIAQEYYDTLQSLPMGTVVATNAGFYSLGLFYAISEGTDLIPIVYPYLDTWNFEDYRVWLNDTYNLDIPQGDDTKDVITQLLGEGREVYFAHYDGRESVIRNWLEVEGTGDVKRVIGVVDD